jgi:hypothetical protein
MQRMFTIEIRVDYADPDKNDAMRTACRQAGQHVNATACLLADGVKPDIAIWSDDFFAGRDEIELIEDTIQKGLDSIQGDAISDAPVSDEMLNALREGRSS